MEPNSSNFVLSRPELSYWSVTHNMDTCFDKWSCSIISCSLPTPSSYRKAYDKYERFFTAVDKREFIPTVQFCNYLHKDKPPMGIGWWSKPRLMYLRHLIWLNSPNQARLSRSDWRDTPTPGFHHSRRAARAHLLTPHAHCNANISTVIPTLKAPRDLMRRNLRSARYLESFHPPLSIFLCLSPFLSPSQEGI